MITFTRFTNDLEDSYFQACCAAASKAGYTVSQAEECNEGGLDCPDCPFREPEIFEEYPRSLADAYSES